MIEEMHEIPTRKSTMIPVPKAKPQIYGPPGPVIIDFPGLTIPRSLSRELILKCGASVYRHGLLTNDQKADKIAEWLQRKDAFVRLADSKPLSIVTGTYRELDLEGLAQNVERVTGTSPNVRYIKKEERVLANFPLNLSFPGLNLLLDSGEFGVYGGSGASAAHYGISWYNHEVKGWMLFLDEKLDATIGKIIHRKGEVMERKLERVLEAAGNVESQIVASKDKRFTADELTAYLSMYVGKGIGKESAKQLGVGEGQSVRVYDLACRLTQVCQYRSVADITRRRMECIAGELVLCYDEIKADIQKRG